MRVSELKEKEAIEYINKINVDSEIKNELINKVKEISAKINPACLVDNTFIEETYGDVSFIQVCPKSSEVKAYKQEESRRQSDPLYIRTIQVLKELDNFDKDIANNGNEEEIRKKASKLNDELTDISKEFEEKFVDNSHILRLIVASIEGNPLKQGSWKQGKKEQKIETLKNDIKEYPPALIDLLRNNAVKLFEVKKEEEKN